MAAVAASTSAAVAAATNARGGQLLRMVFSYDILCPQSWLFYQLLQQKLPRWRAKLVQSISPHDIKREEADEAGATVLPIDYRPMIWPFICQETFGSKPALMLSARKRYLERECAELCAHYGLEGAPDFQIKPEHLEQRSISALLLLNAMRWRLPAHYEPFLRAVWRDFWAHQRPVNRSIHFLRLGREVGIPFPVMDDLLMRTEEQANFRDLTAHAYRLLEEDRITGSPWFQVFPPASDKKLFAFCEPTRLDWVDELVDEIASTVSEKSDGGEKAKKAAVEALLSERFSTVVNVGPEEIDNGKEDPATSEVFPSEGDPTEPDPGAFESDLTSEDLSKRASKMKPATPTSLRNISAQRRERKQGFMDISLRREYFEERNRWRFNGGEREEEKGNGEGNGNGQEKGKESA